MQIYQTKLSKASPVPTQLEFLQAADQRNLLKTKKELSLYHNLEAGNQGEEFVLDMLEKFGCKHWIVLRNLWLDHYGIYENDIVLLTSHAIYILEVKNYEGEFEYKNSRCYMNGRKLKENCIHQAEKAWMNLREICHSIDQSIHIKGALLFVGEHNEVVIQSEVDGIEIVTRNTLRKFIQSIKKEEEFHHYSSLNTQKFLSHFERNEVLNPFGPLKSYLPEEVLKEKHGIYCKECGNYDTQLTRKFLKCSNGHVELRDSAILRTINEFEVLIFMNQHMTRTDLMKFMDNKVSKSSLINLLNKHFIRIHNGRHTKYKIKYSI